MIWARPSCSQVCRGCACDGQTAGLLLMLQNRLLQTSAAGNTEARTHRETEQRNEGIWMHGGAAAPESAIALLLLSQTWTRTPSSGRPWFRLKGPPRCLHPGSMTC